MSTKGKLVVLKLDGNLEQQGFLVSAQMGADGDRPALEVTGTLPAAPELRHCLHRWQQVYRSLGTPSRIRPKEIIYGGTINRLEACRQESRELGEQLNGWLESPSFRDIDQQLRESLSLADPIRLVIRTTNPDLKRLPWHLWNFVDRYTQAEVALGAQHFRHIAPTIPPRADGTVRILAILGSATGIDVDRDRTVLQQLPQAAVTVLVEPSRPQFNQSLWEQAWDILFFAGHSQSEAEQGRIYLNAQDSLTLDELQYGLRQAIAQGLQLAIFNSCDGLGLAHALEQLHLPQMIVMREPVPDPVAQEFVQQFLTAFVQGESLYLASRQARERLQGLEGQFPCASWLPVICQSSLEQPMTWQDLVARSTKPGGRDRAAQSWCWQQVRWVLLISWIVTTLVMGLRLLGGLQFLELAAFDHLLRLRPPETEDNRLLLITVDEPDLAYQDQQRMSRQGSSLSNQALLQVLAKLEPYKPVAVGLDIYREQAISSEHNPIEPQMAPLFVVCTIGGSRQSPTSIAPPPGFPVAQIGFGDTPLDPDQIIRRQFVGASPSPQCNTDKSLNYLLARHYLHRHHIAYADPDGTLYLGDRRFAQVTPHSAAYHRADLGGYSLFLNYRGTEKIAPSLALSQLLRGQADAQLPDLVRDRIVLIGTTARSFKDYHQTPLGEMAGVEIQAHMVSQILSAMFDDRPLLWALPQWGDAIWVGAWAMVGATLVLRSRSRVHGGLLVSGAVVSLAGVCFLLLLRGAWLPLVPSALAMLGSGYGTAIYRKTV